MTSHVKTSPPTSSVLKRGEGAPLWSQVKSAIFEMIVEGKMPENARLPSEAELCAKFGVSRIVVREALNQLVSERLIYKHQGKGAFVASRRDDQDFLGNMIGFSGELTIKHKTVSTTVLYQELEQPGDHIRQVLKLAEDTLVTRIDRVMKVDGVPRMIIRMAIVDAFAPGLHKLPMGNRSLYEILNRQYGVFFEGGERWIEATSATADDAMLLNIAENTPLVSIESRAYSAKGDFVEYYHALYHTDKARLHFVVKS